MSIPKQKEVPAGILVEKTDSGTIRITRTWERPVSVILIIIFIAFVLIVYFSLKKNEARPVTELTGQIIFTTISLLSFWFIYMIMIFLLNKTRIDISKDEIRVRHKPLWWPGKKRFKTGQISKLYCSVDGRKGKPGYMYKVMMISQNGKKVKILPMIYSLVQAKFIVTTMQEYLNR